MRVYYVQELYIMENISIYSETFYHFSLAYIEQPPTPLPIYFPRAVVNHILSFIWIIEALAFNGEFGKYSLIYKGLVCIISDTITILCCFLFSFKPS